MSNGQLKILCHNLFKLCTSLSFAFHCSKALPKVVDFVSAVDIPGKNNFTTTVFTKTFAVDKVRSQFGLCVIWSR